jgi:pyruvate-formate lyase
MRRDNLVAAVERGEKAQRLFLRVGGHGALLIAIQAARKKFASRE